MRRLNYNQLYYFYIIASLGSIKDACEKLHLTQPTISGQLKALEEDLGYKLFDRKYRKLILNEMGKLVFQKIENVFLASEELTEAPPETDENQVRLLRVGILKTVPSEFMHKFSEEVDRAGNLNTLIKTGHLSEFIDMMKQDKLDIVLSDAPYTCLKNKFSSINLGGNNLCAVGSPKYLELQNGFPESLEGTRFLQYTKDNPLREELEMFFNFNNINPNIVGQIDDINLLIQMVRNGNGTAIVPKEAVEKDIEMGVLVELGAIDSIREVWWDIRPHPGFGTVEMRMCDGAATMGELLAITAFMHCTAVWLSEEYENGNLRPPTRHWILRENKWRAARWGLEAQLIQDDEGNQVSNADIVKKMIDDFTPLSRRLNCHEELMSVREILDHGPSYLRQRKVFEKSGQFEVVVDALVEEWKTGERVNPN